jgi:hypothetical protein
LLIKIETDGGLVGYGDGVNMIDKGSCRAFADRVKAMPEGFNAFKFGGLGVPSARFAPTLDQSQIRYIATRPWTSSIPISPLPADLPG